MGFRMAHCSSLNAWRGGMHWQIRTAALQIPSNFVSYLRTRPRKSELNPTTLDRSWTKSASRSKTVAG